MLPHSRGTDTCHTNYHISPIINLNVNNSIVYFTAVKVDK